MKMRFFSKLAVVGFAVAVGGVANRVHAQQVYDFNVQSPDYYYTFNDDPTPNPEITLVRGKTYTFNINTDPIHPFMIYPETGVQNNNINSGVITFHVPTDAQSGLTTYFCSFHGFGNSFNFVDATPTPIQLLSISVSTNLVLVSTGASNTNFFPEYSTDLTTTNWFALTVTSNRFFGGTNETICGRPPGSTVFVRIRSQAN
jgi:hypothetical protein